MLQADLSHDDDETGVHTQDGDRYSFVQNSFREYLAACRIAGMGDAERHDLARRHALHAAWEQVFVLVVSRLDASDKSEDAQRADSLIQELIAVDALSLPALGGRDPTHLALRLATQCAAAGGKQSPATVSEALRAAWWRLWREEERRYHGVNEGMFVLLTLQNKNDTHLTPAALPRALGVGLPALLSRLAPRRLFSRSRLGNWLDLASLARRFSRSRWWVWLGLASLVTLGLLVVAQVSLAVFPAVSPLETSGWGAGLAQPLSVWALIVCFTLAGLRLYGGAARTSAVRYALLIHILNSINRSPLAALPAPDASAVESLLPLLSDADPSVRHTVAQALGRLGANRAVGPLVNALRDEEPAVRQAAARTLGQLGDAALEALLPLLGDADPSVRQVAAQALGSLGDAAL